MTARREVSLGAVQETLLIPLYARAAENRKPDPALRDARAIDGALPQVEEYRLNLVGLP